MSLIVKSPTQLTFPFVFLFASVIACQIPITTGLVAFVFPLAGVIDQKLIGPNMSFSQDSLRKIDSEMYLCSGSFFLLHWMSRQLCPTVEWVVVSSVLNLPELFNFVPIVEVFVHSTLIYVSPSKVYHVRWVFVSCDEVRWSSYDCRRDNLRYLLVDVGFYVPANNGRRSNSASTTWFYSILISGVSRLPHEVCWLTRWIILPTTYSLLSVCGVSICWVWDWFYRMLPLLDMLWWLFSRPVIRLARWILIIFSIPSSSIVKVSSRTVISMYGTATRGIDLLYDSFSCIISPWPAKLMSFGLQRLECI